MIIFDFWFLLFIGIVTFCGVLASEIENFALGTATFVLGMVGLQWMFSLPIWQSIVDNPLDCTLSSSIRSCGALYTLLWRWPEYIREHSHKLNDAYQEFKKRFDSATKEEFIDSPYYSFKAQKHTNSLATWVLTWPFSMLWEVSRKPIKYTYRFVYAVLGDAFEVIGKRVASRILK